MRLERPEQPEEGDGRSDSVVSEFDRALLLAMRAWAEGRPQPEQDGRQGDQEHAFVLRYGDWIERAWANRLCSAWDRQLRRDASGSALVAQQRLRAMHAASARVEPANVHPSWWVRALQDESPAVQRAVSATFAEPTRHSLQAGLLLDSEDLKSDRAPDPRYLEWVMGLWSERLVGGEPERTDDPPAVIAMTRLSRRAGYRLCRMAGLAKICLAGQSPGADRVRSSQHARRRWLQDHLTVDDAEGHALLRRDVQSVFSSKVPACHRAARIGLITFGRLLADVEAFRLRWALQHWPYAIAKMIRSSMPPPAKQFSALMRWESLVLKVAWDRLTLEKRLELTWPGPLANGNGSGLN
jgi:hypothetical protein